MEEFSYYIDSADGLKVFDYQHLVALVNNGTFSSDKKVLIVDNYNQEQKTCKLRDIL